MPNSKELRLARRNAENALAILRGVEALPRKIGSKVYWSNGVIWTRVGDNQWEAWSASNPDYKSPFPYSSEHVASGTIVEAPDA